MSYVVMLVLCSLYNLLHIEHPSFYFENMLLVIHLDTPVRKSFRAKIFVCIFHSFFFFFLHKIFNYFYQHVGYVFG
jgi:hypothetical protein